MRTPEEILTLEEAEDFVRGISRKEESLLLEAILKSLGMASAQEAADNAGYTLERQ